jgi:hypothetical protein
MRPDKLTPRTTLRPGDKGTKQWCDRFGRSLLFVRYRYDRKRALAYTTVEIVVDVRPWKPTKPRKSQLGSSTLRRTRLRS